LVIWFSACDSSKHESNNSQQVQSQIENSSSKGNLEIGSYAPDFSFPNPEGKHISVSDFKGKYLFLDFWASWCTPCRKENPDFVKIYDQFRGQNFEILGIALDKKRENWIDAIKADGLEWPQVSDLKYFDSEIIELYNIQSVPTTILLDPQGKIIAKNLHAKDLENLLSDIF